MKKIFKSSLLISLALIMCLCLFSSCCGMGMVGDNQPEETVVELDSTNYMDYFDISVEYYNYTDNSTDGGYVLGVYLLPTYKANVSQRVKITPKSNVISVENVTFKHFANWSTTWTYDPENNGDLSKNQETNNWIISLSSNGMFDGSKTMYYCSLLDEPECPVPQSKLNILYNSDVTGTVTVRN